MDEPVGVVDAGLRLVIILSLLGWNVFEALSLRTPYPSSMLALWDTPVWRMVMLFTVWLGAEWCPRIGLMTGIAATMYIVNMIQFV